MPNRRAAGYMPRRHKGSDVAKKAEAAAESRQKKQHQAAQSGGQRADATDAGDFSRDYEQWPKGDLYNRARQLNLRGRSLMTKRQLIAGLRRAERKRA